MAAPQRIIEGLDPKAAAFYRRVAVELNEAGARFLGGGAYALHHYTGVARHTKDFDLFVMPSEVGDCLRVLADAGFETELTFPHWLAKARAGDHFVDLIFSSGNGVATVDEEWFRHAEGGEWLGLPIRFCPVEETIWSKSYVMERERFDGADVAHLLRARGERLDWRRLLRRFGPHWRVLLAHLVMFGFVYPGERAKVPAAVMGELLRRLRAETSAPAPPERLCRGTLVSREQYLTDVGRWGYRDARLAPRGPMSAEDVGRWTEAIETGE